MEQSELLGDIQELFVKQPEEMKGLQQAALAIRFTLDEVIEWMSQIEEGGGSRMDRARSFIGYN